MRAKRKFVVEGLTTLVDVGGGISKIAKAIAQTFPSINCTVFDPPHIIANQEGAENLDFVAGELFESVPYAIGILLKVIKDTLLGDFKIFCIPFCYSLRNCFACMISN